VRDPWTSIESMRKLVVEGTRSPAKLRNLYEIGEVV
jgi:hypothetical protein